MTEELKFSRGGLVGSGPSLVANRTGLCEYLFHPKKEEDESDDE